MKTKRVLMSLSGVIICAVSVGLFKHAALGVDPFQSLMSGLNALIPISFGTLYAIVNLLLLAFALLTDRHNVGIATAINLFFLGYVTEFTLEQLQILMPVMSLPIRVVSLLIAIVVLCFGSSLYMTADLGVSPYDAVAIALTEKWKLGKFKYCRAGTDIVCVIIGIVVFLISGGAPKEIPTIAGVGTIITAFFMGPLIEFFNVKVARPLLKTETETPQNTARQ